MNTIEIYVKSNTNYNKNGDITLDPISCIYKDSENLITLEHFQDEEGRWKYIEYENVIAIEENEKKILYRIYNVVRSLYKVIAYARPIFYDLVDKVLLDVRPTNKLGQEAINIILAGTGFTGHSNLTTLSTSYYIRKNIVEALIGDMDNSFINRWGGEFYCENYDIYINDRIGSDNGVRVEFGYNLNEIEEDINIENVVTRIIPVGFNGIMLEGNSPWVDSLLINKYTQIKMRVIEFSDVKVKENSNDEEGFNNIEEARAELIRRCNKLYEGGIDKPTVNYKIDMINIANTIAYEGLEMLVDVKKGDTVTCYIPHLDIDVKARVVDFEEDKITGEYISIELGNEVSNFFKDQADVLSIVKKITNDNGSVKANEIQGVINAIQTQFKALRDIAQPQDVRAIIFEDRVENSPTFGCMVLGTMGFEIASKFKPGTQEWDFRTFGTGQGFMADCIIAGILMSRNGVSWINLDNGTFDYANGNLSYDGLTMQIIGKIINVLNGYGVEMDQGGLMFATNGEVVGGIRSSKYNQNNTINGLSIVNTRDGDYIDIGFTESEDFEGNIDFYPVLRISKIVNQLLGNFKGIQLLENTRLANMKTFYLESNDSKCPHEIYNTAGGLLALFGDNGTMLGYIKGSEKVKVLEIVEAVGEAGVQAYLYKNLSMAGNKILGVSDIFTGTTSHRYHHDGWCGSIEATAKRISNLNVFYDSGWYAYSSGSNGAPSSYGVILHLKWGETDFVQIAFDFANTMYQRAWVNGTWTNWTQR
ncbi:phage tail protein [Clostridium tertium]|uniref:phage tail spike protein n=1 Tax=Clostridium tertium TaxID=1559 RepID=UPI00232BE78F|nr:phage tail spike protein [Clostridium tertium]MDB1956018.1 phage tail protein [Clostridium tertium]MDB1959013.1 phage tail protein [Clostridium tertium]MDB1962090.1 phage tail protein [Clostridium tertium]MDB1967163.1 phage tail protein [Clostridium tertium]